jgi:hypothetical protein
MLREGAPVGAPMRRDGRDGVREGQGVRWKLILPQGPKGASRLNLAEEPGLQVEPAAKPSE